MLFRSEDDAKLNERAERCKAGGILCGECKNELTSRINVFLEDHQARREKARGIVGNMTYDGFEWNKGGE